MAGAEPLLHALSWCCRSGGLDRARSQRWHSWAWCTEGWKCGQGRPSHDGRNPSSAGWEPHGWHSPTRVWCGWSTPCSQLQPHVLLPWCSPKGVTVTHSSDQNHLARVTPWLGGVGVLGAPSPPCFSSTW